MRSRVRRAALWAIATTGALALLVLVTLAVPVPTWRTGELPVAGAVVTLLRMGITITLVLYDAARGLTLTGTDLGSMAARDGAAA
ncbi:MAG: hypothetical protein ACJ8H8_00600, partial [Geminicoccaceae bacterium]